MPKVLYYSTAPPKKAFLFGQRQTRLIWSLVLRGRRRHWSVNERFTFLGRRRRTNTRPTWKMYTLFERVGWLFPGEVARRQLVSHEFVGKKVREGTQNDN